ncbi:MAG: DUF3782 domain-containing protein [Magnetococcus sp. DMHC-6]
MPHAVTFDDVWKMFKETDRQFKETDRQFKETDRKFQETDRQFKETDRQFKETDRQFKETDRKFQETDRKFQETDRKFQETENLMKETDRKLKEVSKLVGNLGGRWGEFVEGLVAPACETVFAQRGIPVHKTSRKVKAKLSGNRHIEIDVLVVNTDTVVLVEVKSTLTIEYVREHLQRLAQFKEFFPEYAHKRVVGAVSGIVIEESVDRFAMNQGLFVLMQSGDTMVIANEEGFVPCAW